MAVIKISDQKNSLPPIMKISIGNQSKLVHIITNSKLYNSLSSMCK